MQKKPLSISIEKFVRFNYLLGLVLAAVSCVVFPNSFKLLSALAMAVIFVLSLSRLKISCGLKFLLFCWTASSLVTITYTFIGAINNAPQIAVYQVLLIYIISPLLWLIGLSYLITGFSISKTREWLIYLGLLGSISVFAFYYMFFTFGLESVSFLNASGNVDNTEEGYIAGSMFVFGSLIPIFGGYFALFSLKKRSVFDYLLIVIFSSTALISGRSALLLSICVGFTVGICISFCQKRKVKKIQWFQLVGALTASTLVTIGVLLVFELDPIKLVSPLFEKIASQGGDGRAEQLLAFIDGIDANFGLGSGHGIGVSYKVSEIHPWRYEMIWIASIYRTGIIGALVYATPHLILLFLCSNRIRNGEFSETDTFFFGLYFTAFLASNTNPYIEAYVFQWMYVLPMLYFSNQYFLVSNKNTTTPAIPTTNR